MLDSDVEWDLTGSEPGEPGRADEFSVGQQTRDLVWAKDPEKLLEGTSKNASWGGQRCQGRQFTPFRYYEVMLRSLEELEFIKGITHRLEIEAYPQGNVIDPMGHTEPCQAARSVDRQKTMIALRPYRSGRRFG